MQEAREAYLELQVMNAAPQKLRLMLIEGATRFAMQTAEHWRAQRTDAGNEALARCRQIVVELLSSVKPEQSLPAANTAAIYLFLYRILSETQLEPDAGRIDEVVRVLDIERDTWRQVCEVMPEAPVAAPASAPAKIADAESIPAPSAPQPARTSSLSLEA